MHRSFWWKQKIPVIVVDEAIEGLAGNEQKCRNDRAEYRPGVIGGTNERWKS